MKYSKQDFVAALQAADIKRGDLIMVHTGMSSLRAMPEGVKNQDELSAFCAECLFEVLGDEGTLCVPSFAYALGGGNIFDPKTTPTSGIGEFPEYFWHLPGVIRSNDPFLAIAAKGPRAKELLRERCRTSYGYGSFFDIFTQANGKLVTIGVGMRWATIRYHFVEIAAAPFRYMKVFEGRRIVDGNVEPVTWQYSVAPRAPKSDKMSRQLGFIVEDHMINEGLTKRAPIGRGFISSINAQTYRDYIVELLKNEPWISGGDIHSVEQIIDEEYQRTGRAEFGITFDGTDIAELAEKLTPLPRYSISDGYDAALSVLQSKFPLSIEKVLTGTKFGEHFVPERWLCRTAKIRNLSDESILELDESPLMVAANSRSFHGIVTRAELLKHIYCDQSVPYIFRDIQRTWGICCSESQLEELSEELYKVDIDTDFSFGEAKIGEWFLKGESAQTVLLLTYLDTPFQFNDGLSGVIAGLKAMERLQNLPRRFSYRLLIVPYTLGLSLWAALHPELLPNIREVIALDRLATPNVELQFHTPLNSDDFSRRFFGLDYALRVQVLERRLTSKFGAEDTPSTANFDQLKAAVTYLVRLLLERS